MGALILQLDLWMLLFVAHNGQTEVTKYEGGFMCETQ